MTVNQGIADYIVRTGYADIPGPVINRAKECILDSIGVALYGSKFEASLIAFAVGGESGEQKRGSSVLGKRKKIFPPLAAFVNGVMAHAILLSQVARGNFTPTPSRNRPWTSRFTVFTFSPLP